jgi:hypothetical protein
MRNFVYGGIVGAIAMFAISVGVQSKQIQTASIQTASMMSHAQASDIVNTHALTMAIHADRLPDQTINYVD